jgi:S-methylmethionine-dependent homocysteine/selenocysteine methylase
MSKYSHQLPQLGDQLFLTDGGMETTLIFHKGLELNEFSSFELLNTPEGCQTLKEYFDDYLNIAKRYDRGFILEAPTWRANPDWGDRLGYSAGQLAAINKKAIEFLEDIRCEYETESTPMIISGCLGPRGDGYDPSVRMTAEEAEHYHARQINTFRDTNADMISAFTINYVAEAVGITRAAKMAGMPVVISFTLETDGALPTGQSLKEAITEVDNATQSAPAYYMINCAHPTHFANILPAGEPWLERIRGLRGNASTKSHAELDESTELDDGNPTEFGEQHHALLSSLTKLTVLGGCCGTDHRHIEAICEAVMPG